MAAMSWRKNNYTSHFIFLLKLQSSCENFPVFLQCTISYLQMSAAHPGLQF